MTNNPQTSKQDKFSWGIVAIIGIAVLAVVGLFIFALIMR